MNALIESLELLASTRKECDAYRKELISTMEWLQSQPYFTPKHIAGLIKKVLDEYDG